ncbi:MAG: 7,8-didemethyl-8-hydroxy-5-deazariboflavin synthase subunit CofH [Chloroflexi bacterium]|nr:7,8-didemethyl-8-hydroxy-5-deazariboflavin synthase subunit CofH [Chloroflexota bacterium]|tara:strand:+ start:5043 stop:6347 length:1305 start_codon:yes stop_codon:yes gene_type:complete
MNEKSKENFTVNNLLEIIDVEVKEILESALDGDDISSSDIEKLLQTQNLEYQSTILVADELRRRSSGNLVTYVVNRNINFTNVCIKRCGFCAFSRDYQGEQGYLLPISEIVRRAKEAWEYGASEVCIQAGLPPKMEGDLYLKITEAIKKELPEIHIHGFSPEEVLYGSIRSNCSIKEYLSDLKSAGVGSLPGTSAEILDQELRDKISPGRITVNQWKEVITSAHEIGIPTTSTIMFGHVETFKHIADHLVLIREMQKQTGGFTEFVPLSFVNSEAPMFLQGLNGTQNIKSGPTGMDVIKMHAISRIVLNNWVSNIQASWVKEGDRMSQLLLNSGVNDLGGTLINESISTSAGALHGQLKPPSEFRGMIRDAGRIPAERFTDYQIKNIFDQDEVEHDPLDFVGDNSEEIFGSYKKLITQEEFRYSHPNPTSSRSK